MRPNDNRQTQMLQERMTEYSTVTYTTWRGVYESGCFREAMPIEFLADASARR